MFHVKHFSIIPGYFLKCRPGFLLITEFNDFPAASKAWIGARTTLINIGGFVFDFFIIYFLFCHALIVIFYHNSFRFSLCFFQTIPLHDYYWKILQFLAK